jgi:alcohol dehydrogenase (NADP+)
MKKLKFKNGDEMPIIGLGTWKSGKGEVGKAIKMALEAGYRHIDCAATYGNETEIGAAFNDVFSKGNIKREDVWITSKLWNDSHLPKDVKPALQKTLKDLQLDYLDLYLMHWPGPAWKTMHRKTEVLEKEGPWYYAADICSSADQMAQVRSETWRAMEDALREGKVRAIGVSNFSVQHLEGLKRTAKIWPPAVNQVECHPLYPQTELLEYCRKEGILIQAYASLGGQDTGKKQWNRIALEGDVTEDVEKDNKPASKNEDAASGKKRKPKQKKLRDTVVSLLSCRPVVSLARELNVSPAKILLRWALSQNCAIIPKASKKERMQENADAISFTLTPEQISTITDQVQAAMVRDAEADESGT